MWISISKHRVGFQNETEVVPLSSQVGFAMRLMWDLTEGFGFLGTLLIVDNHQGSVSPFISFLSGVFVQYSLLACFMGAASAFEMVEFKII